MARKTAREHAKADAWKRAREEREARKRGEETPQQKKEREVREYAAKVATERLRASLQHVEPLRREELLALATTLLADADALGGGDKVRLLKLLFDEAARPDPAKQDKADLSTPEQLMAAVAAAFGKK